MDEHMDTSNSSGNQSSNVSSNASSSSSHLSSAHVSHLSSSSTSSNPAASTSSSSSSSTDDDDEVRSDLPMVNDNFWPLIDGDPEEEYIFGEPIDGGRFITLASGISIPQLLAPVRAKNSSEHIPMSLYAKSYLIEREVEMQAIMLHIRTWYGIDKIDRPGCGKVVKGYIASQKVNVENDTPSNLLHGPSSSILSSTLSSTSSSSSSERTLPQITIIFEGSPRPQLELRSGFDDCYTYFANNLIGRGGNAGIVTSSRASYGGVYYGMATDFTKPLPPLAIKRVDGRDILAVPEQSRPAKNINNNLGVTRLQEEINTWASVHYPSPHPRVIRIFDAFLDSANVDGCNVASIVMEAAPPGKIANPQATPQAIAHANAKAIQAGQRPPPIPASKIDRPSDLVDFVLTTRHALLPLPTVHVMSQVLMTLFHMHNRFPQIIHRDIKGDNIILWDILEGITLWTIDEQTNTERIVEQSIDLYLVKLADFGEARFLEPDDDAYTNVGTDAYKAPEVGGKNPQTPAVDVYSCGVTMYTLLLAAAPFGTDPGKMHRNAWLEKLKQGAEAFNESPYLAKFSKLPREAQTAIIAMMNPNPTERITIPELFNHPLFKTCRKVYYKVGNKKVPLVPDFNID